MKNYPWLCDGEKDIFPLLTKRQIISALSTRNEMIGFCNSGLRPAAVYARDWDVAIFPHDRMDEEDQIFKRLFDSLEENFPQMGFALSCQNGVNDFPGNVLEVDRFDPPLIARVIIGYEGYVKIRRSMVRLYGDDFVIFPDDRRFFYCEICGYYSLLAASSEFLASIGKGNVRGNWENALGAGLAESVLGLNLRNMRIAYSYHDG